MARPGTGEFGRGALPSFSPTDGGAGVFPGHPINYLLLPSSPPAHPSTIINRSLCPAFFHQKIARKIPRGCGPPVVLFSSSFLTAFPASSGWTVIFEAGCLMEAVLGREEGGKGDETSAASPPPPLSPPPPPLFSSSSSCFPPPTPTIYRLTLKQGKPLQA